MVSRSVVLLILLVTMVSFSSNAFARSVSWDTAIANVEELADQYHQEYKRRTGFITVGTAANNAGLDEHPCAIAGRMLGLKDKVAVFEPPLVSFDTTVDEDIGWEAASLSNWVYTARHFRSQPRRFKAALWNLSCAHKVPGYPTVDDGLGGSVKFAELSDDEETLVILGPIERGFYDKVKSELDKSPHVKYVSLGSPGGAVVEALKAGRLIRDRGLITQLYQGCYSACPFVFMAGVRREIWDSSLELGFHQVSIDGEAISGRDEVYGLMFDYAKEMGVDVGSVISWVFAAQPSEMHIVEGDILCASGLVDFVYHGCASDVLNVK